MYTQFFKKWFSGTPVNAKKAELETEFVDSDADLKFTATKVGTEGNSITVELIDPEDADVEASAELNGNKLVIILGTDEYEDITTTAEDIVELVEEIDGIEDVLTVEATGSGYGVVEELAETELEGGQYATPCRASKGFIIIGGTLYMTNKPVDKWTEDGWYSATPSQI